MYGKVTRGQRAVVTPEPAVGGRYNTKISVVDPVIDAASGTIGVRMELRNRNGRIPAGARCKVEFF
jgi:multidrug efflux pump subunit AcrA (membrane-fusion protein)